MAKGPKVWVNAIFILTVIGGAAITIIWPIGGFSDRTSFDLSVPVAIGDGSVASIHRLEVRARALREDLDQLSSPRPVKAEWIICGPLVLVLASVWKEAGRMAEEESLTV